MIFRHDPSVQLRIIPYHLWFRNFYVSLSPRIEVPLQWHKHPLAKSEAKGSCCDLLKN